MPVSPALLVAGYWKGNEVDSTASFLDPNALYLDPTTGKATISNPRDREWVGCQGTLQSLTTEQLKPVSVSKGGGEERGRGR